MLSWSRSSMTASPGLPPPNLTPPSISCRCSLRLSGPWPEMGSSIAAASVSVCSLLFLPPFLPLSRASSRRSFWEMPVIALPLDLIRYICDALQCAQLGVRASGGLDHQGTWTRRENRRGGIRRGRPVAESRQKCFVTSRIHTITHEVTAVSPRHRPLHVEHALHLATFPAFSCFLPHRCLSAHAKEHVATVIRRPGRRLPG
ncbi:hypothetical protein LXA43DRAFT_374996 [Ganoderma leucocontextum]|nr:hypothetical protein LXA43DRAFT_374996 [Ganoderma leucocontextum]